MKVWKILTIDDDGFMQKVIYNELNSTYSVIKASSGKEGLEVAQSEQPDIILLDVEMPGMNGYEVCDTLKHHDSTKHIPIIFLSSLSNIRSKMLGYEAGAADFLVKPFEAGELLAKLKSLVALIEHSQKIEGEVKQATSTAFLAMKDSNELGQCINFIETTYAIKDFDSLACSFFNISQSMGLNCSLMFTIRNKRIFYSGTGNKCSALEEEVISTIFEKGGRFIDFGCRTQINYSHVALLIKNMPLHDSVAYGRHKDFFPFMLGATDEKVKALEAELGITAQTNHLTKALDTVKNNLSSLQKSIDTSQEGVINLLRGVLEELDGVIPQMGLEEDQEKTIVGIIDTAIVASEKVIDTSEYNSDIFTKTTSVLEALVEKQQLLTKAISSKVIQRRDTPDNDKHIDELSDDVELF